MAPIPTSTPDRKRPERIAVIGSGPTGLTVASDLAQRGFQVTIYEAKERLGGMLRYGIPNYRLPDYALDKDIDHILSLGIEVVTGVRIGADMTLDDLLAEHTAVVVTAGLQGSRPLPIPGADMPTVLSALPFLEAAACGEKIALGKSVVVVGGGNVAMDVARTARRMGAEQGRRHLPRERRGDARLRRRGPRGPPGGREAALLVGTGRGRCRRGERVRSRREALRVGLRRRQAVQPGRSTRTRSSASTPTP